ncbi:MAG: hypothetical protein LCH85_00020 [Chloroflexi bacterium]|nr:hypothetical protein [Chloroflexota bacterium]
MEYSLMWQPLSISRLSIFELAVDAALTEIQNQWVMLYAAIQSHGLVHPDAIVQAAGIDEAQTYGLTIYAEQGRRWQQINPTKQMQQQLDRVLTTITQATIVNAEVIAVLALIHAMDMHSQNKDWLIAVRTMLSQVGTDDLQKAFAWSDKVLLQQSWTIGQAIELRRLWSLIWLAYDNVPEALWEAKVAIALWTDGASAADHVTYAQLWELMIQCWLRQADAMNAAEAAMTLVAFVDMHKDSLFTQPDGPRLWLEAAYHRALVAEFALDYPMAAMWYAEAQQRAHTVALATHHPMRWLIAAGMARGTMES